MISSTVTHRTLHTQCSNKVDCFSLQKVNFYSFQYFFLRVSAQFRGLDEGRKQLTMLRNRLRVIYHPVTLYMLISQVCILNVEPGVVLKVSEVLFLELFQQDALVSKQLRNVIFVVIPLKISSLNGFCLEQSDPYFRLVNILVNYGYPRLRGG